jgi:hypothetical protein
VDAAVVISLMRMAAADRELAPWQRSSDDRLVRLGVDALLAGVEAPSLPGLAGLARNEYRDAPELFDQVLAELRLLPLLAGDIAKARWTAAIWWARQIVADELDPLRGARLIWLEAAAELDYPDAMQPIVELAGASGSDEQLPDPYGLRDRVTAAAHAFLTADAHRPRGS